MVASSLQDDLRRAAQNRTPFSLEVLQQSFDYRSIYPPHFHFPSQLQPNYQPQHQHQSAHPQKQGNAAVESDGCTNSRQGARDTMSAQAPPGMREQRMVLFFKGLAAWALCVGTAYAFDVTSLPMSSRRSESEANSSVAFALLMHCTGFRYGEKGSEG